MSLNGLLGAVFLLLGQVGIANGAASCDLHTRPFLAGNLESAKGKGKRFLSNWIGQKERAKEIRLAIKRQLTLAASPARNYMAQYRMSYAVYRIPYTVYLIPYTVYHMLYAI